MKKTLLSLLLLAGMTVTAQNNIALNIDHMLDDASFAFYQEAEQASFVFEVERLQYYISDISIVHDGGTVTDIEDVWLLVDASSDENFSLGTWDIDQVESIIFHIGVGPDVNNADPTQWPSDHPLYPQNPTMHWGWASGYRFIAMEGMSGATNADQVFEIHALGNEYYFAQSIDVSVSAENGEITIPLVADYVKALNDMNLSGGTITHGSFGVAITLLENFSTDVFSAGTTNTSVNDLGFDGTWAVMPNPSSEAASLMIEIPSNGAYFLSVRDITGRQVFGENLTVTSGQVSLPSVSNGTYLVELLEDGQTVTATRWIVH